MGCGNLLDIEPPCGVLYGFPKRQRRILTIYQEHFWNIGIGQFPSLLFCMKLEVRQCNFSGIHSYTFPDRFFHRKDNLICLGRREIKGFLEIIREARHVRIVVIFQIKLYLLWAVR